jgi:hypothetical protein
MTTVFVTIDSICNIVQIAGGTLFGISQSGRRSEGSKIDPELGQNVLRAGLALQVVSWVIFIAFLGVAIWRANRTDRNPHLRDRRYDPLRWYLWAVLAACILILWRACYRLAEAITGMISRYMKSNYHALNIRFRERTPYKGRLFWVFRIPAGHSLRHCPHCFTAISIYRAFSRSRLCSGRKEIRARRRIALVLGHS